MIYYLLLGGAVIVILLLTVLSAYISVRNEAREYAKVPLEVKIYPDFKPALGPLVADRRRPRWFRVMRSIGMFVLGCAMLVPMIVFGIISGLHFLGQGRPMFDPESDREMAARFKAELMEVSARARVRMQEVRKARVFEQVLLENCRRSNQERRDVWNELTRPRREYHLFSTSRSKNGSPDGH